VEPHPGQPTDELLIRFLSERSPSCPVCKYSLTGLTAARCPECGTKLRLTLEGDSLPMREWTFGMVGATASVGIASIFWIMVILTQFMGSGRAPPAILIIMTAATLTGIGALWWWCSRNVAIRQWTKNQRLLGALGCWLAVGAPYLIGWALLFF
jgi:hypothetical protein